jgi:phosphomannomutase
VTGSHIPYDRNGYKTNTSKGELLKRDEAPIQARVEQVRARLYAQEFSESRFGSSGMLKCSSSHLPRTHAGAAEEYLRRYIDFFAGRTLQGLRLLVYQHSAVGRDLLVELLGRFGAEVIPAGRSETFVPIDTEAIDEEQMRIVESLAAAAWKEHGRLDAVVSTDGDSDRPLILGVDPAQERDGGNPCRVRFFSGDLVGMVVAEALGADAVVVPISCNDALDRGPLKNVVKPRTRIGSPFVIAGMQEACKEGCRAVCGWEANGGFLLGSDISQHGRVLKALPTRDAFLPILVVLLQASELRVSLSALFDRLPHRFSRASLLKNFPRTRSQQIIARFTPADELVREISFQDGRTMVWANALQEIPASRVVASAADSIRKELEHVFNPSLGFDHIARLNFIDGVRIYFSNGDVAHIRPSGNADELRIYALADSQARADAIAQSSVAEPNGILRQLEKESIHSLN